MTEPPSALLTAAIAAVASGIVGLVSIAATYFFTRRREHEADWRKLKFAQYQEYVLALSGAVQGRQTLEAHKRYADAVNSLALVGSASVLSALWDFQREISYLNKARSDERHDALLLTLLRAMREDLDPTSSRSGRFESFRLLGLPPEYNSDESPTDLRAN